MDYPITKQECGRIRTLLYDETGRLLYHRAGQSGLCRLRVFGLPKEATKLGGVDTILPLGDIASAVLIHVSHHS